MSLVVSPVSAQQGDLDVSIGSIGVGGVTRLGEWMGVRVDFRDASIERRELLFRITFPDVDGDTIVVERAVASNQDVKQSVWLYTRLPISGDASSRLRLSVYEAEEGSSTSGSGRVPGQRLFTDEKVISPVAPSYGLIARIGDKDLGLGAMSLPAWSLDYNPSGQERVRVTGLDGKDLPDRWHGLAQFDTIIWTQGEPTTLTASQSGALRDWIYRGGHFVVVLPPVGQTWIGSSATNLLSDVMPNVTIERLEATDLEPYRPLVFWNKPKETNETIEQIQNRQRASRPLGKGTVYVLKPADNALMEEAMPILAGPNDDPVVTRRLLGTGMVTLVGLDLAALAPNRLPNAEQFWNRVIGLRGSYDADRGTLGASRTGYVTDGFIGGKIESRGTAAAGVLLGFLVFSLYWVIAAPVSFFILKKREKLHHAWIGFLLSSIAFTVIAWGGAVLIRPHRVSAQHITVLEHVYGQPVQRARSWFNIMVPWYGDATIGFDESVSSPVPLQVTNNIAPFDGLSPSSSVGGKFPDARTYAIDARSHNSITFPVRQTVKQFQADWVGGPQWNMPRPVDVDGTSGDDPVIRQNERQGKNTRLHGILRHDLPGPLQNVTIIISWGQRGLDRHPTALNANAEAWKIVNPWAPGEDLDLAEITTSAQFAAADLQSFISTLVRRPGPASIGAEYSTNVFDGVAAASLLSQFPEDKTAGTFTGQVHMTRYALHGWDIGKWLMQPCVIILGEITDYGSAKQIGSPVPIILDGRPVRSRGSTVIRWIYPLPTNPPEIDSDETTGPDDEGA
ncbi:MAG: hypothetical protein H6815_09205 [Phycisphaeraceae bacterium]|nr:hypothetical protein [Phycisphaerales bacterium]MCB9860615.1 hypothetical protein [Phycisphaeraceae bacterium]